MTQFRVSGYWTSFSISEGGYERIVYECSACHKFTYKGKLILNEPDYCPNCHAEMFEVDYVEEGD